MKPVLLMATALFLISAPPPDSGDIAEITANFIVPASIPGSLTADQLPIPESDGGRYSAAPSGRTGDAANDPGEESDQDNPESSAPAG